MNGADLISQLVKATREVLIVVARCVVSEIEAFERHANLQPNKGSEDDYIYSLADW